MSQPFPVGSSPSDIQIVFCFPSNCVIIGACPCPSHFLLLAKTKFPSSTSMDLKLSFISDSFKMARKSSGPLSGGRRLQSCATNARAKPERVVCSTFPDHPGAISTPSSVIFFTSNIIKSLSPGFPIWKCHPSISFGPFWSVSDNAALRSSIVCMSSRTIIFFISPSTTD